MSVRSIASVAVFYGFSSGILTASPFSIRLIAVKVLSGNVHRLGIAR
ncbi:MAG: hypothetical protein OXF73_10790 [Gammaproteobacteria bacterium]|nr:hypothetical protein [Gammaproteobacteria bacterium]